MITVLDIIKAMEAYAPARLADDGDNVGLMVGRKQAKVERVLVALDADLDTIKEAKNIGADIIVCHHPLIHKPISSVTDHKFLDLIENKIAVFSAHTNLDWTDGGVNDILAKRLGITEVEAVVTNENGAKIGRMGKLQTTFGELVKKVNALLGGDVKYVGDTARAIEMVGLCGGGGGELIPYAVERGCDVFITADLKYHQAGAAKESGICLIDAGHFETENVVCEGIANYLKKVYNNIDVVISKRENSYFTYE